MLKQFCYVRAYVSVCFTSVSWERKYCIFEKCRRCKRETGPPRQRPYPHNQAAQTLASISTPNSCPPQNSTANKPKVKPSDTHHNPKKSARTPTEPDNVNLTSPHSHTSSKRSLEVPLAAPPVYSTEAICKENSS